MPTTASIEQTGFLDGAELNSTFMFDTDGADTCVVAAKANSDRDAYDDPELLIEFSHVGNDWFGDQVLRLGEQSNQIVIKAPLMRVRVTTANSTAMRINISVALRKGS